MDDFMCDNDVMLDPRLIEYMNKRKYYTENDINPAVSLEKQFNITKGDIKRLKKFIKGDRNLYGKDPKKQKEDSLEYKLNRHKYKDQCPGKKTSFSF
jgi:hypothetical protein